MSEPDLDADGYLIDLDGTLIAGRSVLPDALWLLEQVRGRFVIVSNNAEHTPHQLARALRAMGLGVAQEQLLLAGTAAIDTIAAEYPGASVLLLASASLRTYARRSGLRLDQPRPDIVLVARDRHFSYARLAEAADALSDGARFVVAAPDRNHPGANGKPVPETGALAAAILACVGPIPHRVIGKPEPALFEMGCARLGIAAQNALMIGDNPETDGLGSKRIGMRFLQVERGLIRTAKSHLRYAAG
ncbi:HAD-IIA family hydrolase [Mycoplana dimorpha]|uniref:HAD superfamily hydrolase (TIGR01450 family) n=1 Tax=Mycoplana dimorpha TaxID=28320 RepID=A0A2T5B3K2_MYCDI|nr:HAD family hydrolase [Mycoplana dimorpha]PTM93540.1 HAD superfamily hydrolase (TIGR01450 family) [Mycoplana dimorpha]